MKNPQMLKEIFLPQLEAEVQKLEQPIQDKDVNEGIKNGSIKQEELNDSAVREAQNAQKAKQVQKQSEQENIVETNEQAKEEQTQKEISIEEPAKSENEPKETVGQPAMPEEHTQDEKQDMESVVEAPMDSATSSVQAPPEEHTQKADNVQSQEVDSQENALVNPDKSFIGKVKRFMANMRDMKNKDSSKGFFARFKSSFKTVFGNKNNEDYLENREDMLANSSKHTNIVNEQESSFDKSIKVTVPPLTNISDKTNTNIQKNRNDRDENKREKNQEESEIDR